METILQCTLKSNHPIGVKKAIVKKLQDAVEGQEQQVSALEGLISVSANFLVTSHSTPLWESIQALLLSAAKKNPLELISALSPSFFDTYLRSESAAPGAVVFLLSAAIPKYQNYSDKYRLLGDVISEAVVPFVKNSNRDLYALNTVLTLCLQNPVFLPRGRETACALTKLLLRLLANLSIGSVENAADFISLVETTSDVISALWRVSDADSLRQTIALLFSFVADDSNPEEPHLPLAAVVKHIRLEYLSQCVTELLDIYEGDEKAIKIILHRMTNFLRWPRSTNLDAWILMLVLGLAKRGKTVWILEYIRDYVSCVMKLLPLRGIDRPAATTLLEFMLLTHQHNHNLVELVAQELPAVCQALREENSPSGEQCLHQLAEVGYILTFMHKVDVSTMPAGIVELLRQYARPTRSTMLKRIRAHKWSYITSHSVADFTKQIKRRSETGCVGLLNVGNTCYANAALQLLYNCMDFRKAVLNNSHVGAYRLRSQFHSLFASLENPKLVVSDPGIFVRSTRPAHFIPGEQQDAAEYLGHLLDSLHEEERCGPTPPAPQSDPHSMAGDSGSGATTLVQSLFSGQVDRRTSCVACHHESKLRESFYFLFLPLSTEKGSEADPGDKSASHSEERMAEDGSCHEAKVEDVAKLVQEHFSTEENVQEGRCEACGGSEGRRRSVALSRLPPYVFVCLNLFTFNRETRSCTKLLRRMRVPEFLPVVLEEQNCSETSGGGNGNYLPQRLGVETEEPPVKPYVLKGMIMHHGVSMSFGHYTCVCRVGVNWVWFDDDTARFTQLDQIGVEAATTPYVLVYSRV